MTVPVPRHRHRIYRVDLVASAEQRRGEQTVIGFDPNDHLLGHGVLGDQGVQSLHAGQAVLDPACGQPPPFVVFEVKVVLVLIPVDAQEHFHRSVPSVLGSIRRGTRRGVLMDQCSTGTPPQQSCGSSRNQQAHDLELELHRVRADTVLSCWPTATTLTVQEIQGTPLGLTGDSCTRPSRHAIRTRASCCRSPL